MITQTTVFATWAKWTGKRSPSANAHQVSDQIAVKQMDSICLNYGHVIAHVEPFFFAGQHVEKNKNER
jgi:hypothetical protein